MSRRPYHSRALDLAEKFCKVEGISDELAHSLADLLDGVWFAGFQDGKQRAVKRLAQVMLDDNNG